MQRKVFIKSMDTMAYFEDAKITFEKRVVFISILASFFWLAHFTVLFFKHGIEDDGTVMFALLRGLPWVLSVFAILLTLISLGTTLSPSFRVNSRIDFKKKELWTRKKTWPLSEVIDFDIRPLTQNFVSLHAVFKDSTTLILATVGTHSAQLLQDLKTEIESHRDPIHPTKSNSATANPPMASAQLQQFQLVVTVGIGFCLCLFGYFFFPDLYITSWRENSPKIPLWSIGLIPIAIGLYGKFKNKNSN